MAGSRHRFSDILADILSGILSDILFDIYFWHSTRHIFWHSFWRSFWHPIVTFFLTFFLWHFIWHMFWHSICQSFCICSDILCSGPAVVHCIRSPRYGLDRFMPTVTTSWQWRRRRRRTRKRRRSFTWQAAGTTNSLVEDLRGSSSGHWTIKRVRPKYQTKYGANQVKL